MTDMTRVYVVEKLPKSDNPADKDKWLAVGTYDTPAAAADHAQDLGIHVKTGLLLGVRVRQFWVEATMPAGTAPKPGKGHPLDVSLVGHHCSDHPNRTAGGYPGGVAPRCPDCHRAMVPMSFTATDMVDLTKGG